MHYELYADSLFLMNFGMNLYLLFLVNYSTTEDFRGMEAASGGQDTGACVISFCFWEGFPCFYAYWQGGFWERWE